MSTITASKKVANFIREKRLALGMTQGEFAVYVFGDEKHRPWINKIENQKRGITLDTLGKILKSLKADIEIIEY